jgi:Cu/Ag efflux protein CusF
MRFALAVLFALSICSCQKTPPPKPIQEFTMQGEVMSLDPAAQTAHINAGAIEGWMEAMAMDYPVKDKQEFQKLKVGDHVQAKVDVQGTDFWIASANPMTVNSAPVPEPGPKGAPKPK